jgi:hypothetical protein
MMEDPSAWQVTLMSWPDFLGVMINREGLAWRLLARETDLIVGGLDFECDFLCVNWNIIRHMFLT